MKKRKKATQPRATRSGRTVRTEQDEGTEPTARGVFAMAAECTVADAGSLKSGLAKLLDDPDTVTLDISALQRIDTAGLQVIAAFVRDREAQGRAVQWQGGAPALVNAAGLLGVSDLLKLPPDAGVRLESAQ